VFACYVLALLPATLIAGPVADTAGVRPVVAVSVVLAGVTTMLLAADPSWWLAAGRLGGWAAGRLPQGVRLPSDDAEDPQAEV
jgi:MFS family permease